MSRPKLSACHYCGCNATFDVLVECPHGNKMPRPVCDIHFLHFAKEQGIPPEEARTLVYGEHTLH